MGLCSSNVIMMKCFSDPLPSPWNLTYFHESYLPIILVKASSLLCEDEIAYVITNYKGMEWLQGYGKNIAQWMSFAFWGVSARKKPAHEKGKCFKKVYEKVET